MIRVVDKIQQLLRNVQPDVTRREMQCHMIASGDVEKQLCLARITFY